MANVEYIPRLVDKLLSQKLSGISAVLVRGPKWAGKTTTCEQLAASMLKLRDPDVYLQSVEAAQVKPSLLLNGSRPRLIDEWQLIPKLWDTVISESDNSGGRPNQFLLTGSATPVDASEYLHTGTGRIGRLDMESMTLQETGESTSEISLANLFEKDGEVKGSAKLTVEDYAEIVCRGGWPAIISNNASGQIAHDYIESLCESDIVEASKIELDPDRARALLRSIARNSSQEASNKTILEDVKNAGIGMSEPTLRVYINALRRLFVITDLKAWGPTLRSRTPLRSAKTWHLCDPSLAAAALDVNAKGLLSDLITFGYLFESLCIHDLRVYARMLDGSIYHYRDKSGLEADAIIRLQDGRWAAVEVKLGGSERIEEASTHLKSLAAKVDASKTGEPSFLMVLTGGSYAYTRADGVHVVPLGCLSI